MEDEHEKIVQAIIKDFLDGQWVGSSMQRLAIELDNARGGKEQARRKEQLEEYRKNPKAVKMDAEWFVPTALGLIVAVMLVAIMVGIMWAAVLLELRNG